MKLKNVVGRWIRRGALASTSLTVLLGAGSAGATESCPTPTLEICQGDGYLTSTCGQQHSTLCNDLIGQEYERQWSALTTEHVTLMPKEFGGGLATSRPTPYTALGSTFVENGGGSYANAVLKKQVLYRKKFQNLTRSDILLKEAMQQWEANGTNITSCKEFIHEKFYDFSQFESRMGAHGADHRAIFEAAYAADGIAYKQLKGKAGNALAPIFNAMSTAPKNLYFKGEQGPYPPGMQGYQIDPTLLQLIPTEGRRYYTPSWEWHDQMSDSLAQYHDDVLNRQFDKQLEFSSLVDRRRAVWASYEEQAAKLSGAELELLRQKVTEKLIGLDRAIEAGLQEAQADNCLGLKGNRCDWSPRRFKHMVDTEMLSRRHGDYALCLAMTGNDFSSTSFVRNADSLGIAGLSGDYTTSAARLNEYMNTYRQALLKENRLVVPFTGEIRRSESRSSSDSFGNSNFGAGYEYGAGWEFNTTSNFGICQSFDARVYAYFEADARVFGTSREIVYASAEGTATANQVGYDVLLRVLGADVYHASNTYPTSFSVTKGDDVRKTFFSASTRFLLLGIPVKVSGGVSGKVGIEATLSGEWVSGCRFKLAAGMTPSAQLDAFAEAAVDVVIAAVGVRGELELVGVDLPYDASLQVYLDTSSGTNRVMFDLDTKLQLKVSTLDGRVVVFARAFGLTAEKELASFNGVSTTTTLMSESRTVPLNSFF